MKYANKFETQAAYNTWKSGSSYVTPNVGLISSTGELIYQKLINSNGHDYVDLGLPSGTLWATCNLGSNTPSVQGGFYAWGETSTKSNYTWETYAFGTEDNLTKYNESDGKRSLELVDDAAHVIMGGDWHIPTPAQLEELFYYVEQDWDTELEGRVFRSTINGNIIVFHEGGSDNGEMNGTSTNGLTQYWFEILSNKLCDNTYIYVQHYSNDGEGATLINYDYGWNGYRYCGFQIRAVIGTLDIFTPPYQPIPR